MSQRQEAARLLRAIRRADAHQVEDLLEWAAVTLPDSVPVQRLYIESLLDNDDLHAAEAILTRILLRRPDHPAIGLLRAQCLARRGNWNEADAVLDDVLQQRPCHARTLHLAGEVAGRCKQDHRAVELLQRAVEQGDGTAQPLLVDALLCVGSIDRAYEVLQRMAAPSPLLVAAVLRADNRPLDAIETLERAVEADNAADDDILRELIELTLQLADDSRLMQTIAQLDGLQHPQATLEAAGAMLSRGRFVHAAVLAAPLRHHRKHHGRALAMLTVAASLAGRNALAQRAHARLCQSHDEVDRKFMAHCWQQGMMGRLLCDQHDVRRAGRDPGSSILQALLAEAGVQGECSAQKSRRIKDSAGAIEQLSERKNVLVSSPVVTPCP